MTKLKEKLENHIVVAVLGFSMSVGVAVYSVVSYFHSQEIKQLKAGHEISTSEQSARLASIERGMPDQRYFDIRNLIASSENQSEIPFGSQYFLSDQFYALRDSEYWRYSKTTENELVKLLTGESLPESLSELGRAIPMHLWKSDKVYQLESDGNKTNWFPFVVVQKLPFVEIPTLMNLGNSVLETPTETTEQEFDRESIVKSTGAQAFVDSFSSLMRDDVTGIMFHLQTMLSINETLNSSNQRYRLLKVQKLGNVLYSQAMTEHMNVVVNGQPERSFFVRQELILISTRSDLYIVKFSVPSLEPLPRGRSYAEVNGWLAGFRVVIDLN